MYNLYQLYPIDY